MKFEVELCLLGPILSWCEKYLALKRYNNVRFPESGPLWLACLFACCLFWLWWLVFFFFFSILFFDSLEAVLN